MVSGSGIPRFAASSRQIRRSLRIQSTANPKSNSSRIIVACRFDKYHEFAATAGDRLQHQLGIEADRLPRFNASAAPSIAAAHGTWLTIW